MYSTRKIIRVFIASPGDLQEERQAVRDMVDEFNVSWADELGYQVELIGWEETVARFGRPQHLINQDLDRCDLFLGMIWKRWGTPPDHDREFSSGFEEEFERSIARCEETGSPEISLFFKQIPDEFKVDPGDNLKKVMEFREGIISGKKILFQDFSTVRELETLTRKCVTAHVNRIRAEDESSEPDEQRVKRGQSRSEETGEDNRGCASPLSAEGFEFLESFVERIRQPGSLDRLSASDVARFRLLANSISKQGNDETDLGVHDINILFAACSEGVKLCEREIRFLSRLGFQHFAHKNVPLWCWYSALSDSHMDPAVVSSFLGVSEEEKVGAISVLTALDIDLPPTDDDLIKRDCIVDAWFSDGSSARLRTAALGYLAKCGSAKDLEIAQKEYDRSDHGTARNALECMVEIMLRTGQAKSAQQLLLESQFESLDANLLRSVIDGFEDLETSALLLGLEHRNSKIRLRAMKTLRGRGKLDIGMAERLFGDSNALIRREAVSVLLELGKLLGENEIKKILVSPQKQTSIFGIGLDSALGAGKAGEKLFQKYQLDVLKSLPEAELEKKVGASFSPDDAAYFALVERYFRNHADEMRCDIDDRFCAYFEERIRRIDIAFGDRPDGEKLVKSMRDLEEFMRKKLTRKGLDVLCAANKPEDLKRIRSNLRDGYAGASKLDAEYLGRHGEWNDILMLANAAGPRLGATLLFMSGNEEFQIEVAKAITSIGKKYSISDLLSLEIPAGILKKIIELCAESRFAKISQDALLSLLDHKSDGVRKAAAIMAVRALTVKRIKSILRKYVSSDKYRYYDVIHWLDLGASMSRVLARKVARAAIS